MAASSIKESNEQLSGLNLNELLDEDIKLTPDADQVSGIDLTKLVDDDTAPAQDDDQSSGIDLTKLVDDDSAPAPDDAESSEIDLSKLIDDDAVPDDDQFSGIELDEGDIESSSGDQHFSGIELDELEGEESIPTPGKKISRNDRRNHRGKRRFPLLTALMILLLIGIGFLYLQKDNFLTESHQEQFNQKKTLPHVQKFEVENFILLTFESFVIPFKKNMKFSYLSLSISLTLPNKELKREMIGKKDQLRGIIYDTLRKEIIKTKTIPPLEKVKYLIIRRINRVLSAGKISDVYITQFFAV